MRLAIATPARGTALHFLKRDPDERTLNRPCGGRYGDLVEAVGNTPLVELPTLSPKPGVQDLRQARGAEPHRVGQGPGRQGDDRGGRGRGRDRARADRARADLGQHRDLARDDLPAQGLPTEGRDAGQRHRGADPAAADVRGRDRLLRGGQGIQRRRRAGARDGRGGSVGLHALPVRQRGQPPRPLRRHRPGDPRGAGRGHRVRRRASAPAAR